MLQDQEIYLSKIVGYAVLNLDFSRFKKAVRIVPLFQNLYTMRNQLGFHIIKLRLTTGALIRMN